MEKYKIHVPNHQPDGIWDYEWGFFYRDFMGFVIVFFVGIMNGDFLGPINGMIIRTDFSRVISSLSFWGLLYLRVGFNPLKNIG